MRLNLILPCVSRIVAFVIKNIITIIFFACFIVTLDSSHVDIEKIKARMLKKQFGFFACACECSVTRATILGMLWI